MTDQQRWDTLGCTGNKAAETPNLDWIASQGTLFEHAYSTCPSCIPARTSLFTGMKPWNTGILGSGNGQGRLTGGFSHTMPGELASAGYHAQAVGHLHFEPQRSLNGFHHTVLDEYAISVDRGFVSDYQQWFEQSKGGDYGMVDHGMDWNSWMARPFHAPEYLHPTNWTVNESLRLLQRRDPSKPFFLHVSFTRPHSPYDPPSYYFDLCMNKQMPKPYIGPWSAMHDVSEDAVNPNAWRGKRGEEEIHRARAGYYGSITHIDHQLGRLLSYLTREKLLSDTVIVFTSDHGDMLGDHHLWRKTYAYEGSAHIPMIVRLPPRFGTPVRSRCSHPVSLEDVMPTVLEAAGLAAPGSVDGSSMMKLMLEKEPAWREYVHGEHCACYSEQQEMQYLTDGKRKYIWFPRLGTEQLFDLSNDPGECIDLADRPERQAELHLWRRRLVAELAPRRVGLTDGEQLVCQAGMPPIISPHYQARVARITES
jgi:arylsulfatase A-like enzyme